MLIVVRQADFKKKKDKDFVSWIKKAYALFNKYYLKTDMSPLYAAALILNLSRRTRYIEINWPKKQAKPALAKVKKLQEKHREETLVPPTFTTFSYEGTSKEPRELDTFNQIARSLEQVARPASKDEFEDYNS